MIVLADADSYVSDDALARAIDHADGNGWGMPHSTVRRLSRQSTATVLAGGEADGECLHAFHSNLLDQAREAAQPLIMGNFGF